MRRQVAAAARTTTDALFAKLAVHDAHKAALDLATGLPPEMKKYHLQRNVGHYGIFNGGRWRREIAPVVKAFIREHDHTRRARKARLVPVA